MKRARHQFQPKESALLCQFTRKGRTFLASWYTDHPWVTLCTGRLKVFCVYCRYAKAHNLLTFSLHNHDAFGLTRFGNYKKAVEKFNSHSASKAHQEAVMKCSAVSRPSIQSNMNTQLQKDQRLRRSGLVKQIKAIRFLTRQGLALRGHHDKDGNLYQLLRAWADDDSVVMAWLRAGRFLSHDHVNEVITLMGHDVLRKIIARVQHGDPAWYALIADEATDVTYAEQLNISVRYVDKDFVIHEDSLGLCRLPSTDAATISSVIKDVLLRTSLPLSLCRGQAYDGAATMQGVRSGVATRLRAEEPAAIPVHCLAHSLNLCLQDAGRKITLIRDSVDVVKEIVKLVNFSSKRKSLFSSKVAQLDEEEQEGHGTIKPNSTLHQRVKSENDFWYISLRVICFLHC